MPTERVTDKQRARVIERSRGLCEYCRCPVFYSPDPFSVDHIIPTSKGGKTRLNNLAHACLGCNGKKHDKLMGYDPLGMKTVRLFNPRRQRWQDHFGWNEDFTIVIGLTPTGRATVAELDLNRSGAINLRQLLHQAKKHPPIEQ